MIDDKTLALLGDREAAERLTAAGVLLECPFCGGGDISERESACLFGRSAYQRTYKYIFCEDCYSKTADYGTKKKARLAWNTRAPVLTPAQMALIRIGAEPRKFENEKGDMKNEH